MAAYRRVCDSRHLQADCKEPASAPEPYARHQVLATIFTVKYAYRLEHSNSGKKKIPFDSRYRIDFSIRFGKLIN